MDAYFHVKMIIAFVWDSARKWMIRMGPYSQASEGYLTSGTVL